MFLMFFLCFMFFLSGFYLAETPFFIVFAKNASVNFDWKTKSKIDDKEDTELSVKISFLDDSLFCWVTLEWTSNLAASFVAN